VRLNRAAAALKLAAAVGSAGPPGSQASPPRPSTFFVPGPLALLADASANSLATALVTEALSDTQAVLNRRPGHAKALFRLGQVGGVGCC
jgi:hypothetical protein